MAALGHRAGVAKNHVGALCGDLEPLPHQALLVGQVGMPDTFGNARNSRMAWTVSRPATPTTLTRPAWPAARQTITTWPEVAWAGLDRQRQQLDRTSFDERLGQLAETAPAGVPRPRRQSTDPVVCPWFRFGDQVVKTIGIATRFESAAETTLDELRIELTHPSTPPPTASFGAWPTRPKAGPRT